MMRTRIKPLEFARDDRPTGRPWFVVLSAALLLTALAGCGHRSTLDDDLVSSTDTVPAVVAPTLHSRVVGDQIVMDYGEDHWDFMAGVNLGVTIPGHYPGELAIDAETYRRWFPMMAGLGFNTIRVYTIQNPSFYRELQRYNRANQEAPLFLIQGVWFDEELYVAEGDLYETGLTASVDAEIVDTVGAVTGNVEIPQQPGHAHGSFNADVTDWIAAWIIGIEPDPTVIRDSDNANHDVASYSGRYFAAAEGATPTESWYAARLDRLASELRSREKEAPLAFTNWPTTDPIEHPAEPITAEDLVAIDANHVVPTAEWTAGYFASYHAYPYFPDFQKYEAGIADYVHQGAIDPYAGYLDALRLHHVGMPVVIAEFGVAGGMALAHRGPLGRDQGALNESSQMATNAEMLQVIHDVGMAGGLVFEWADEWFKSSWNTNDYELPRDRKALWDNQWTNESQFGILAIEPGLAHGIVLDGRLDDWDEADATVIAPGGAGQPGVRAHHDAGYLYLLIESNGIAGDTTVIGFDVVDGSSGGLPGSPGMDEEADVAVVLRSGGMGEAMIRASNDPFGIKFGLNAGHFAVDPADYEPGSGAWNRQRLLTSYPLELPTTGEQIPAEAFDVGRLINGSTDPAHGAFDSRATRYHTPTAVEVRLPYAALGISDPSSHQAVVVASDGGISTSEFERVGISVMAGGSLYETAGYMWDPWSAAVWHERLRVGSDLLAATLREVSDN
jgi:hypothetical protein